MERPTWDMEHVGLGRNLARDLQALACCTPLADAHDHSDRSSTGLERGERRLDEPEAASLRPSHDYVEL
jgi:hypothetical protein